MGVVHVFLALGEGAEVGDAALHVGDLLGVVRRGGVHGAVRATVLAEALAELHRLGRAREGEALLPRAQVVDAPRRLANFPERVHLRTLRHDARALRPRLTHEMRVHGRRGAVDATVHVVLLKLHVLSPDVRALVVAVEGRHAHREDGRRKSPRRAVEGGVADVARALDSDVVRVARLGRDDGPAGARLRKRTSQKISKFFPSVLPIEKRSIFPGAAFGRNSAVGDVESGRVNSSILESGETCVRERSWRSVSREIFSAVRGKKRTWRRGAATPSHPATHPTIRRVQARA